MITPEKHLELEYLPPLRERIKALDTAISGRFKEIQDYENEKVIIQSAIDRAESFINPADQEGDLRTMASRLRLTAEEKEALNVVAGYAKEPVDESERLDEWFETR